jgi:hypothetical protein
MIVNVFAIEHGGTVDLAGGAFDILLSPAHLTHDIRLVVHPKEKPSRPKVAPSVQVARMAARCVGPCH